MDNEELGFVEKKVEDSFLATNKRMDELIQVVMDMRDQFKYLKAEIRASNQRLEVSEEKIDTLEKQVNELRISR